MIHSIYRLKKGLSTNDCELTNNIAFQFETKKELSVGIIYIVLLITRQDVATIKKTF